MRNVAIAIALVLVVGGRASRADVALPKVFGDHLVLQREREVPVWGTADAGEEVTVRFGGKQTRAKTGEDGRWTVRIGTGPASAEGRELVVAGKNTVTFKDVLVGEVWLCGGQSNMEYPVDRASKKYANPPKGTPDLAKEALEKPGNPMLRLLWVEKKTGVRELPTEGWTACDAKTLSRFSAVGYFFGREIAEREKVPVGLIHSNWGGSRIESWMMPGSEEMVGALKEPPTTRPGYLDGGRVGNYYEGMIGPIAPYGLRGVLWYQGESNIITTNDGMRYRDKMEALVKGWRKTWGDEGMVFVQVQLAPFVYSKRSTAKEAAHPVTALPELWEAQDAAAKTVPHVGVVVINDLVDRLQDIHPWNKWEVGHRLALWAEANVYGEKAEWSGPVMKGVTYDANKAVITFEHAEGLKSRDGEALRGFEMAGEDGKWAEGEAEVHGETVEVRSAGMKGPRAVRYLWTERGQSNLVNEAGLPAGAFRVEK